MSSYGVENRMKIRAQMMERGKCVKNVHSNIVITKKIEKQSNL